MAITYPLSIETLADRIPISGVVWHVQRNDQFSGIGSGQFWQAELAPPLWTADIAIAAMPMREALRVAAIIRSLDGSRGTFYLYDPQALYPWDDPDGTELGSSTVTITSVGSNKWDLGMEGFPAGYRLRAGDKFQLVHSETKESFHEVARQTTANGSGQMIALDAFPAIPAIMTTGDAVILKKPQCRMVIYPDSFNPGTSDGVNTTGASFKAIQKRT